MGIAYSGAIVYTKARAGLSFAGESGLNRALCGTFPKVRPCGRLQTRLKAAVLSPTEFLRLILCFAF